MCANPVCSGAIFFTFFFPAVFFPAELPTELELVLVLDGELVLAKVLAVAELALAALFFALGLAGLALPTKLVPVVVLVLDEALVLTKLAAALESPVRAASVSPSSRAPAGTTP